MKDIKRLFLVGRGPDPMDQMEGWGWLNGKTAIYMIADPEDSEVVYASIEPFTIQEAYEVHGIPNLDDDEES